MADNYCKCRDCKNIDPTERSGYKWYCTEYHSYEDPDTIRECRRYESQNGSTGCFLTSACCQHKGLPDYCFELTALRNFRDNYLMNSADGERLISEYYSIAPVLVEKINRREDQDDIYEAIYTTVCRVVDMLGAKDYDKAIETYREMVLGIQDIVNKEGEYGTDNYNNYSGNHFKNEVKRNKEKREANGRTAPTRIRNSRTSAI